MAVNEKPIYAESHTTHGGKLYAPGDRLDGRMPDYALQSAIDSGVATDSASRAKSASEQERQRQAYVNEQIANRSEKREANARRDGSIKQLVRLPDGTLAEVN